MDFLIEGLAVAVPGTTLHAAARTAAQTSSARRVALTTLPGRIGAHNDSDTPHAPELLGDPGPLAYWARMRVLGILSLLAVSIALPASASAASDGIIVDPNTPSGKEYAIPLDQAIQEQGGTRATSSGEPSSLALFAPLFGRGLSTSPRAQGGAPLRGGREAGGRDRRTSGAVLPGGTGSQLVGDPVAAAAAGRDKGSSVSSQLTLGIPLAALVAGVALLLFVRRRNRPHP